MFPVPYLSDFCFRFAFATQKYCFFLTYARFLALFSVFCLLFLYLHHFKGRFCIFIVLTTELFFFFQFYFYLTILTKLTKFTIFKLLPCRGYVVVLSWFCPGNVLYTIYPKTYTIIKIHFCPVTFVSFAHPVRSPVHHAPSKRPIICSRKSIVQ